MTRAHPMPHGDATATVIGIGFMTIFGLIWWLMAAGSAGDWQAAMVGAGLVVTLALLWQALSLWRSARGRDARRPEQWEARQRIFSWIGMAEGVAIAAGVIVGRAIGHSEWIPAWCMFVVGVHFLPLARLFDVALYLATGILLALGAIAIALVIAIAGMPHASWFAIPGAVSAVLLWATSGLLLRAGMRAAR